MQATLNGILSVLAAGALTYVVMSPRINEGGVTKLGMVAMILSLIVSGAYSFPALFGEVEPATAYNAALVLRGGIVVVCIGYWLKFKRRKRDGLPTDWQSLTER